MKKVKVCIVFCIVVFVLLMSMNQIFAVPEKTIDTKETKAVTVLKLAEVHPKNYPTTKGDFEFARLVEEKSNGRITLNL